MTENSQTFQNFITRHHSPVIAQVLPALNLGGVEQGVIDINAAIVKAGGKSIVISNGGRREKEITNAGGMLIHLPVHSKNPLTIFANIKKIRDVVTTENVDILHACSRAPAWSAQSAVKGTKARYVTSCHSAHKINNAAKKIYNASITKGARVIAVSHFLEDYLKNNYAINAGIIRVIHRGLDAEYFNPDNVSAERCAAFRTAAGIAPDKKLLMLPARITRSKGHKFLIDAICRLNNRDFICLMMGSDTGFENYHAELKQYIKDKNLTDCVQTFTQCRDIHAAFKTADLALSPSTMPEGFGRVPIEAQAMGTPVITTNHGGACETVVDGETGWLVPSGDTAALAAAIQKALSLTPENRTTFAQKSRQHVLNNFTNSHMCRKTLDVYAEVLGL